MYIFFKKGTRGEISYISNRYNKASSNKFLKSYNPKQESKQIIYLDVDNLYGYTKSKFPPTSGLKLIGAKEFNFNRIDLDTSNNSKGGDLKVDL